MNISGSTPNEVTPFASGSLTCRVTGASTFCIPFAINDTNLGEIRALIQQHVENSAEWTFPPNDDADGTYPTGGGMREPVDLVLCTRRIAPEDFPPELTAWTPTAIVVTFYIFGAVTIQLITDSLPNQERSLSVIGADTKEFFSIRTSDQSSSTSPAHWLQEVLNKSAECVSAPLKTTQEKDAVYPKTPLMWLHPITISSSSANPRATADRLTSDFRSEIIRFRGGIFAPGIGRSAISLTGNTAHDLDIVLETVDAHWAMYASYLDLDRTLYDYLDPATKQEDSIQDLVSDADEKFTEYLRAAAIGARIDTYLASKGGDLQAVWDCLAQAQCTSSLADAVDRKLHRVRELSERRSAQAAEKADRTTNTIIFWLTMASAVAAGAAVVTFFFDDMESKGPTSLVRIFWIIATIGIIASFAYTIRKKMYRSRPRHKPDSPD